MRIGIATPLTVRGTSHTGGVGFAKPRRDTDGHRDPTTPRIADRAGRCRCAAPFSYSNAASSGLNPAYPRGGLSP
jgi:hypothetical protein